jgi:hypothetical protein
MKNIMGGIATFLLFLGVICLPQSGGQNSSTQGSEVIRIEPSGVSLRIPKNWVRSQTKEEMKGLKKGKGEWQTEYSKILNAALPFASCSLHAGEHQWDTAAASMSQMRLYTLASTNSNIENRIMTKGLAAAKTLPFPTVRNAHLDKQDAGQWHKIVIRYDLSYGDYGGTANIEFYTATHENWTIALVFMHAGTNEPNEVRQILDSFSWK